MGVNVGLAVIKLIVGYAAESIDLIADGFHSFSDLGTDLIVLIGAWYAGHPPDQDHHYGHGKFETMAAVGIAIVLMSVGGLITWQGFDAFLHPKYVVKGLWVITVAVVSLGAKEALYHATIRVANRCHSTALKANAWHHRSDALSSAVVLFGGAAGVIGLNRGDSVAGIIVGVMVVSVGVKLGFEALKELCESSPGRDTEVEIHRIIEGFSEVRSWHRMRLRRVGRELEMDVHIMLDPDLTIRQGHAIVKRIEHVIGEGIELPVNLTIHVDPDSD